MDLDTLSKWAALLAVVLSIGNLVWAWISRPARDVGARVDATNARIDDVVLEVNDRADRHRENLKEHDRRLQRVEDDVRHLPTKDDLHGIGLKLTGVKTELDLVARVVTRIDEALRKLP